MRIAFFHNLPSGGAKRCAQDIISLLSKYNQIDLFLFEDETNTLFSVNAYVQTITIINKKKIIGNSVFEKLINLYRAKKTSKKIAYLINNGKYDIALVMQCRITNSPYLLKYLQIPSLYFCHEPLSKLLEPHYNLNSSNYFINILKLFYINYLISIDKKNALKATNICTSSKYSIENLYRNFGIYPKLNYLGVNTNIFKPINIKKENYILMVGSLNKAKAQDFIIESVGTMHIKPKIHFVYNFIYGDLNYKNYLINLALKYNVEISFQEMATDNDLIIAYNKALLTVFPSRLEPLGLVPLESMSCGTPVIGISEAGIRETIDDGINGILVERDKIKFAEAIQNLIADQTLWEKLRLNGISNINSNWTWDATNLRLQNHLEESIKVYLSC